MVEWTGKMRNRLVQESRHDTYRAKEKPAEPTQCPDCGAVFHEGRWQWCLAPGNAHKLRCPACARIHDHYPAGYVSLHGSFLSAHREEILGLIQNLATREQEEHPLNRIMAIEDEDGGTLITTTDMHLARSIGEAIQHAYDGELDYRFADDTNIVHVAWERNLAQQ